MRNTRLANRHYFSSAITGPGKESALLAGTRRLDTEVSSDSLYKSEKVIVLSAGEKRPNPRIPGSFRVSEHSPEQVPYIEHLGWLLVYLCQRYPELKSTSGFESAHIQCSQRAHRTGFYVTHAFFTIDVNKPGGHKKHTIDVVHGDIGNGVPFWSIEVFKGGGLVRKVFCDSPDQVVTTLRIHLEKYGLIQAEPGTVTHIR